MAAYDVFAGLFKDIEDTAVQIRDKAAEAKELASEKARATHDRIIEKYQAENLATIKADHQGGGRLRRCRSRKKATRRRMRRKRSRRCRR